MRLIKTAALVLTLAAAPALSAQTAAPAPTPEQADSLARALACFMAPSVTGAIDNLARLDAPVDREKFLEAFTAIVRGEEPAMTQREADAFIGAFVDSRRPVIPDSLPAASQQAFIDSVAALPGARQLPSGVVVVTEQAGTGDFPTDSSTVMARYTGRFSNGFVFDSTDEPVALPVGELVVGFSEGLKLMQPGGRYRLVIPADKGYGPRGVAGHIPGNAALDFTIDVSAIKPN